MSSNDGSKRVDPTGGPRRAKTAAEQRQEQAAASDDPEVLAAEIERTREELAETLDAIADKVSPKRVTARTKKKVGDAVKEGAEQATATVKAGAAQLKEAVSDRAETAKAAVAETTEAVKDKVSGDGSTPPSDTTVELATAGVAAGTPHDSLRAPGLHPVPPPSSAPSPAIGPPALIGAAAALLVALLVLRRRRR